MYLLLIRFCVRFFLRISSPHYLSISALLLCLSPWCPNSPVFKKQMESNKCMIKSAIQNIPSCWQKNDLSRSRQQRNIEGLRKNKNKILRWPCGLHTFFWVHLLWSGHWHRVVFQDTYSFIVQWNKTISSNSTICNICFSKQKKPFITVSTE